MAPVQHKAFQLRQAKGSCISSHHKYHRGSEQKRRVGHKGRQAQPQPGHIHLCGVLFAVIDSSNVRVGLSVAASKQILIQSMQLQAIASSSWTSMKSLRFPANKLKQTVLKGYKHLLLPGFDAFKAQAIRTSFQPPSFVGGGTRA